MKTQIFLVIGALLLLTSCIDDYHGQGGGDIDLTEDNYLYEGDLYALYLENEISQTQLLIQELQEIIANNQGTPEIEEELIQQEGKLQELNVERETILDLEQVGRTIPRPRPPCPNPQNCNYGAFQYLLVPASAQEVFLRIVDSQEGTIVSGGEFKEFQILDGTNGQISFTEIELTPFGGPVRIEVELNDANGNNRSYLIK